MPRNVVTVVPRFAAFAGEPPTRERGGAGRAVSLSSRGDAMEIDFPKQLGREARERVVADLDEIAPNWRRLFRLYPT